MLIFAGCSGALKDRTYPHSFNSPQPSSNSLGDACSGWIFPPALTLTRHRGLATVTCRLRAAPAWVVFLVCVCFLPCSFNAVPLEPSLSDRWGLRLVARLRAQQFPDKTAQLPRHCHDRLVALESPRQKTGVTSMQAVLRLPADGTHLARLILLAATQFLAHFGWASVMLGALDQ